MVTMPSARSIPSVSMVGMLLDVERTVDVDGAPLPYRRGFESVSQASSAAQRLRLRRSGARDRGRVARLGRVRIMKPVGS
jgi:hypothetical protein